jgi:hypothetical protein
MIVPTKVLAEQQVRVPKQKKNRHSANRAFSGRSWS